MGSPDADVKENPHKQLSSHTHTHTTFSLSYMKSVFYSFAGRALHWASGLCCETQEEKHGKVRSPEIALIFL